MIVGDVNGGGLLLLGKVRRDEGQSRVSQHETGKRVLGGVRVPTLAGFVSDSRVAPLDGK